MPLLHRHQQVLDLTRDEVREHVFAHERRRALVDPVDYVKWDHNRDLLEAGSTALGGAPAVHDQTLAFYRLLDDLRAAHPAIDWESCASGGGRVDLGVLERVQRFWTSDMTDALARQQIQRWTTQLVAPEYLGAHVSAPTSHTTGRTLPLDFRAATALFGSFGIEWDLTDAERGRARRGWPTGSPATGGCVPCCTAGGWSGPSRRTRPCCCTAWSPPTGPRRSWRTSSSTSPPTTAGCSCGCRACRGRAPTSWPGRDRWTRWA